jgi:hypothetical protein
MATNGGEVTTNGELRELRPDVWSSRLAHEASGNLQESSNMSGEKKGGSDLDIFEGLGKKTAHRAAMTTPIVPEPVPAEAGPEAEVITPVTEAQAVTTAPPPLATSNAEFRATSLTREPPPAMKRTLLGIPGISSPTTSPPPAVAAHTASSPPVSGSVRPPPGRGTLPQVVPPPPRTGVGLGLGTSSATMNAPTSSSTRPASSNTSNARAPNVSSSGGPAIAIPSLLDSRTSAPMSKGAGVDMDWDDEDEATQIFDKDRSSEDSSRSEQPRPNAGAMASERAQAAPGSAAASRTLLGLSSPLPEQSTAGAPAASGHGGAFGHSATTSAHATNNGFSTMPARSTGAHAGLGHASGAVTSSMSTQMPNMPPVNSMPNPMEMTAMVRPSSAARTGLFVGLGAVFAAVVVGALFLVMMPRTGSVRIDITDDKGQTVEKVDIAIDGRKQCDTTPCIVDQLSTGAHIVKIAAVGYEASPGTREVIVDSRKQTALSVALTAISPKASPAPSTGLKVYGAQIGVRLAIDDKDIGPLPQEVRDLEAGSHKIKLTGGDRYTTLEKTVTLSKDEILDLGPQTLKVMKGKATISLAAPGAKVYLVSGSDRRELPTLPIQVDIDTSKSWTLEASKLGMADYKQPISFDDGQAEKSFTVSFDSQGAAAAALAAPQAPQAAGAPPPSMVVAPRAPVAPAAPKAPAPTPAAAEGKTPASSADTATGEAFLNINSMPSSSVVLDGKPIGNTPKLKISVKPGVHTVLFVNADEGLKKQVSVSVSAGETKAATAKLRE